MGEKYEGGVDKDKSEDVEDEQRKKSKTERGKKKKSHTDTKTTRKKSKKTHKQKDASSDEEQEDMYKSGTNLLPIAESNENLEENPEHGNGDKKSTTNKKSNKNKSEKKRSNSNLSPKSPSVDEDMNYYLDPSLHLVPPSLRGDVESLGGSQSPPISPESHRPSPSIPALSLSKYPLLEPVPVFPASQPVDQIYMQDGTGFSKTKHRKVTKISMVNQIQPHSMKPTMTPLDLGLESQKIFRSIGIFSHGFLAGIAFWQIILVFVLSESENDMLEFMSIYSPLSQPLHVIFYLLTVICTISILDRYDLAQFEWTQLQKMVTFRSGGAAVFIYLLSLLLTLVTTRFDDKFSLYQYNATVFEQSDHQELANELSSWKILNLCRCIGVIIGWIVVSLRPSTDLLYKHLKKLADYSAPTKNGKNHSA